MSATFDIESFLGPGESFAVYWIGKQLCCSPKHIRNLIEEGALKVPPEEIARARSKQKTWTTVRVPRKSLVDFLRLRSSVSGAGGTPKREGRANFAGEEKSDPMRRRPYTKRKPRIRSKIATLTDAQRAKLHELFRENLTYEQIQAWLKSECGIAIAASTLCAYYLKHGFDILGVDASTKSIVRDISLLGGKIQIRLEVRIESPAQEGSQ
jgi:hypothetical protein